MSRNQIIHAWKDAEYRRSLSVEEKNLMPQHPSGLIDLRDADLDAATGGLDCNLSTYGTYCSKGYRCL
ncbi:MAG: mersacidin/lichenicidin family type 2 lantibiotic [Terriglobales bacterium]|jgi:mersacidin/lichenicidin family type 2 lantibiotic